MEETLVQWTLTRETGYLQKLLSEELTKQLGTELTTSFGRIDLAYKTKRGDIILIELETSIDSDAKLNHALEQVQRYSKFASDSTPSKVLVVLLYALEGTPERYQKIITRTAGEYGVRPISYSILKIKQLYDRHLARITLNSGAALSRAVTLGVSSLTWLNKIMVLYARRNVNQIAWKDVMKNFNSRTNFYVLKRLAEDFELISRFRSKRTNYLRLTSYGERYVAIMPEDEGSQSPPGPLAQDTSPHLLTPLEHRRLIIEILLNNNFTKTKINIFQFLRYINVTGGELLPKARTLISPDELQYLNNFFGSSYNLQTLKAHFRQLYKYCHELGLIERILCKNANYDKAVLTSLGSRVLTCFELNLHIARERHQIPLQITN
ncbi:MAG: hypothetical protein JSV49_03560 [Thermoplasmata archaeon]|nr:MAG: hypothetical protein JSV49_03560 [Thermoplasmata archaeon]